VLCSRSGPSAGSSEFGKAAAPDPEAATGRGAAPEAEGEKARAGGIPRGRRIEITFSLEMLIDIPMFIGDDER
jgi:hypothetical protein